MVRIASTTLGMGVATLAASIIIMFPTLRGAGLSAL